MDFNLSEEQRAFRATARAFAREQRDVRVHQILEGTNEIMRLIVSRQLLGN